MSLQKLRTQHHKVIQLSFEGTPNGLIATEMNMTPANVRNILGSPLAQAELSRLRQKAEVETVSRVVERGNDAREVLDANSHNASKILVEGLLDMDPKIRLSSAESILDRTGYPKVSRQDQQIMQTRIVLTSGALDRIQAVSQEVFGEELIKPSLVESAEIIEGA